MASFAKDAPSTYVGVLRPVVGGNSSGIHRHHKRLWPLCSFEERLDFPHLRRKATVEPHHQERCPRTSIANTLDLGQFIECEGEGLLHEHVLTGTERLAHQA